jgi:hypothetical protein
MCKCRTDGDGRPRTPVPSTSWVHLVLNKMFSFFYDLYRRCWVLPFALVFVWECYMQKSWMSFRKFSNGHVLPLHRSLILLWGINFLDGDFNPHKSYSAYSFSIEFNGTYLYPWHVLKHEGHWLHKHRFGAHTQLTINFALLVVKCDTLHAICEQKCNHDYHTTIYTISVHTYAGSLKLD